MFIAGRQRAGRVWRYVKPSFVAFVHALSEDAVIVYDIAGVLTTTYSASDGDTSGYSDIWDY